MPVQLNSVNSIIQAYLKGREISQQKQNEETRKAERDEDIKREEQRFKDQQKLIKEQQDIENKRQEAVTKYQQALLDAQLAEHRAKQFEKSGNVPGYEPSGKVSGSISTTPGYATTESELVPTKDNQDITAKPFYGKEPGNAAEEQRREASYILEQKQAQEQQSLAQKTAAEIQVRAAEAAQQQKLEDLKHGYRLTEDQANNRAALARTIAGRSASAQETKPLSINELIAYGDIDERGTVIPLPAGTTLEDIKGRTPINVPSDAQAKYIGALNSLEDLMVKAEKVFGPAEQGGIPYEAYFGGATPGAAIATVLSKIKNTPKGAEIEQLFSDIQLKAKEAENLGAALSGIEKPMLASTAPNPSKFTTPEKAKALIVGYKQSVINQRKNLLKSVTGKSGTSSNNNSPNVRRIRVDEQGNEIGAQ